MLLPDALYSIHHKLCIIFASQRWYYDFVDESVVVFSVLCRQTEVLKFFCSENCKNSLLFVSVDGIKQFFYFFLALAEFFCCNQTLSKDFPCCVLEKQNWR